MIVIGIDVIEIVINVRKGGKMGILKNIMILDK